MLFARAGRRLLAPIAAALAVTLAGCAGGGTGGAAGDPTEITIADAGFAQANFDPTKSDINVKFYLEPVYDTLIRRMPDGSYTPNLATDWSYEDPTTFVMDLREGVTFSDGTPFDAEAAKANIDFQRTGSGPLSGQLAAISEVSVTSPTQLRITLSTPFPSLPTVFSSITGMMVAPESLGAETLATAPVGTGPYVLDTAASVPNSSYVYTKRDDYWNSSHFHYETVNIRPIADTSAMVNALRNDEVQIGKLYTIPQLEIKDQAGIPFAGVPYNVDTLWLLDRAGTVVPALGDQRVRQAIGMAIDRDEIVDGLSKGYAVATSQILKEGMEGYDPALNEQYGFQLDRARQLLAEAGFAEGFTLPMVSTSSYDQMTQALAAQLAQVGITLQIDNVPTNQWVTKMLSGEYAAAYLPYGALDSYYDLGQIALPDGGFNPFASSDPQLTDLYARAGSAATDEERAQLLTQLNTRLTELAWIIPFQAGISGIAHSPTVEGVEMSVVEPPLLYDWTPAPASSS